MPEKGWYSLTIRKETALKVGELAKNKGLTVDELINMLMKPASKSARNKTLGSKKLYRQLSRINE